MKRFIINLMQFILVIVGILFIFLSSLLFIINTYADFKLPSNIDKLFMGHSEMESAFNDKLIINSMNDAQSGEAYFYTYFNLKGIIEQNKNIKTVFLGYGNNQLIHDANDWIWSTKYMSYRFAIYAPFLDRDAYLALLKNNPECFFSSIPSILKYGLKMVYKKFKYVPEMGGYLHLDHYIQDNKTDSATADSSHDSININEDFLTLKENSNQTLESVDPKLLSLENIKYLYKIIDYCKHKNITLYLVKTPVIKGYESKNIGVNVSQIIIRENKNLEVLDFSKCNFPDNYFADAHHLNQLGAKHFSIWFNRLLQSGLLNAKDKPLFIKEQHL